MDDQEFLIKLGTNVATIRKQKGLTQQELSWKCDFDKSNLIRIEKGRTNPTALTLRRLATALEVPVHSLMEM